MIEKQCERGAMLTVLGNISLIGRIKEYNDNIALVSIDYENHFVVSGSAEEINELNNYLNNKGIMTQLLDVNYAYHSNMLDPAEAAYKDSIRTILAKPSRISYASGSTGYLHPIIDSDYLWNIIRGPIRFSDAITAIEQDTDEDKIYIDLGPSSTLINYLKKRPKQETNVVYFPLITPYHNELENLKKINEYLHDRIQISYAAAFPGQGAPKKGMGREVLDLPEFQSYIEIADRVLGYSVKTLCLEDPEKQLRDTAYLQPALYVINCLYYVKMKMTKGYLPAFLLGHSLGEYCALFAAGVFDFETGLKIVKKRGELMARENGGKMAAVVGIKADKIALLLRQYGLADKIAFANYNEPMQTVLSGKAGDLDELVNRWENKDGSRCVLLNVSGAFHSGEMKTAAQEFAGYLEQFEFHVPEIPVISNVTALPHMKETMLANLTEHMVGPVRWIESVQYILDHQVDKIYSVGEGDVIKKLIAKIKEEYQPKAIDKKHDFGGETDDPGIRKNDLGSQAFKQQLGLDYAYMAGPMNLGIASAEMVVRLAENKMLGFISSALISTEQLKAMIQQVKDHLKQNEAFGVGISYNREFPGQERTILSIVREEKIRVLQLFNYIQMTEAYAEFRIKDLHHAKETNGKPTTVLVKLSRPEIAELFMKPISSNMMEQLLGQQRITIEEAQWARQFPASDGICVEADSGGFTEGKSLLTLLPGIMDIRKNCTRTYQYKSNIFVGAAGGIGTPYAAFCMFLLDADFIMTGSVNVASVEAGISDCGKEKLLQLDIQDTGYTSAVDFFEFGSRVQVMKKGSLFCAKARRLYELYGQFDSIEEIDDKTKEMLISRYFHKELDIILKEALELRPQEYIDDKVKLRLLFQWYLIQTQKYTISGNRENLSDFQIYCSSAMGAFNRYVKGTKLERLDNRRVDLIGRMIMDGARELAVKKRNQIKSEEALW